MKSRTLTNILLVVIAVGTLGNFFQGQAVRNSALAYGEVEVKVKNWGSMEAIPVEVRKWDPGYIGDYRALPVKVVGASTSLSTPRTSPPPSGASLIDTTVAYLMLMPAEEREPCLMDLVQQGLLTAAEAEAVRAALKGKN